MIRSNAQSRTSYSPRWGKTLQILFQMPHELGFGVWLLWIDTIPRPVCTYGPAPSNHFKGFFPRLWITSCHIGGSYIQLNTQGWRPAGFCTFRSTWLLPTWYSVLWPLASLVSLDSQLCLLNSGSSSGSAWVPPSVLRLEMLSVSASQGPQSFISHVQTFESLLHLFVWGLLLFFFI